MHTRRHDIIIGLKHALHNKVEHVKPQENHYHKITWYKANALVQGNNINL